MLELYPVLYLFPQSFCGGGGNEWNVNINMNIIKGLRQDTSALNTYIVSRIFYAVWVRLFLALFTVTYKLIKMY